jgi:hypothetical protein
MDFVDQLQLLATRINSTKDLIQTEEATKNAMVMPFIQILGYNPFDPLEVTPELVADIGTKKGEKVDYAILKDGKPILIFECKKSGVDLNNCHASQLFRYFHVTEARFGVLTNGLLYKFFTDLEFPNKMDEKPFFEFNILDFKERDLDELKKFAKLTFDVDTILNTANDLKYTRAIKQKLSEWIVNPSEEFVKILSTELLVNKRFTPPIKDQFTIITKRAFEQLISEKINERLKGAMAPDFTLPIVSPIEKKDESIDEQDKQDKQEIITTQEEYEGFYAVRAMLRASVPSKRVVMRDALSYCAILLDDNNRKPICRLRFNNLQNLKIGFFNENKEEEIISLESIDDIFNHAERLKSTLKYYNVESDKD